MNRRNFLALGAAAMTAAHPAIACTRSDGWQQCDDVPVNNFTSGNRSRVADCVAEFRLPQELLTRDGIILRNGTYEWTLRLITFNSNGSPRWQQAHRVTNSPSREQGIYFGTTVATYITCDRYTGWYSTGPVMSCGPKTLSRVDWPFDWKQLEAAVS